MAEIERSALLDTSWIVRYLTDEPPEMAEIAALVIDSDQPLVLSDVVLAETAYVLESVYGYPRDATVEALTGLIQRRNIQPLDLPKNLVLEALRLCRGSKRHSYADALLWAEARHHRAAKIYTFDRRFPSRGIELSTSV